MKLNQEQIVFIDRYLENSDVLYADIRMEMTDHVASEIEQQMALDNDRSFYLIFKDYMIEHKTGLINNKDLMARRLTLQMAKEICSKIIKLPYLLGIFMCMELYYLTIEWIGLSKTSWYHLGLNLGIIIVLALIYEYQRRKHKIPRFSALDRLGFILSVLVQLVCFTHNINGLFIGVSNLIFAAVFSIQLMLTIAFTEVGLEQFLLYKNRFLTT